MLVVIGPLVLLVVEEKSKYSILELTSLRNFLLLEAIGKGRLNNYRY